MSDRKENWQGMNWVRQSTRLALYLRDGLACVYCGHAVEDGAQLTLDHVHAFDKGGTNEVTNLVTACKRCNSSKNDRSLQDFSKAVANYMNHDVKASDIVSHVKACQKRDIKPFRVQARKLIESRGSVAKVLAARS